MSFRPVLIYFWSHAWEPVLILITAFTLPSLDRSSLQIPSVPGSPLLPPERGAPHPAGWACSLSESSSLSDGSVSGGSPESAPSAVRAAGREGCQPSAKAEGTLVTVAGPSSPSLLASGHPRPPTAMSYPSHPRRGVCPGAWECPQTEGRPLSTASLRKSPPPIGLGFPWGLGTSVSTCAK